MFPHRIGLSLLSLLLFGSVALPRNTEAYALNGYRWTDGTDIAMHLQLTRTGGSFQDGSASWNASAADALAIWNQYLEQVRFVAAPPTINGDGDGLNSVFFATTVYGESFGGHTLAVTLYHSQSSGVFTEADVVFNTGVPWGSYRGPQQSIGTSYTFDFHRVALHEFGHALGLSHPDAQGQQVEAQMNSIISDLDHLAPDDIDGVRQIYRGLQVAATTGSEFSYQVGTRINGASFSAVNLPPGLTLNAVTGIISGIPTISGTYRVVIVVSVTGDSQVVVLDLKVTALANPGPGTAVGALLRTFPLDAAQLAADPVRPRIYASLPGSNSVAVIDTLLLTVIKTVPVGSNPFGLAVSADGTRLWVANRGSNAPAVSVVDLGTLTPLSGFTAPQPGYDVEEGVDGRLYVTGSSSFAPLMQIDIATGQARNAFEGFNGDVSGNAFLECSPDRRTLFFGGHYAGPLVKLDVSSATIVQLQVKSVSNYPKDLALSHDGLFVVHPGGGGSSGLGIYSTAQIRTADLNLVSGSFAIGSSPGPAAFSSDDAILYDVSSPGVIFCFDTTNFTSVGVINLVRSGFGEPSDLIVDHSGGALFYASHNSAIPSELQVYATGRGAIAPPRPKSLLNVSTRLRSEAGDNVLIGGFIITGNEPKKLAVRAIGPSLSLPGKLADPTLELRSASGAVIAANDNWNARRLEVLATGLAPPDEHESTIVQTLAPGSYTAILRGFGSGTGVGVVELYDLSPASDSRLANISTRGKVETGDNVMIGGFIIGGDQPTKVIVRAIGPSLAQRGIAGALADTTLDLHDGNGTRFASNDDWRSEQEAEINASTVPPSDPRESAIVRTLPPGNYTAIVRGKNETTGVALVEVYNLETN